MSAAERTARAMAEIEAARRERRRINLRRFDLRGVNLRGNLRRADLRGADLREANLRGADVWGATPVRSVTGLPSGHAILVPTCDGWWLRVGCWTGTIDGLRDLIAKDDGWPEAKGEQITARRPMLTALADTCEAWAEDNHAALEAVAHWKDADK